MNVEVHMADIVLDEIALEGLDGITLPTLWIRLTTREPSIPFNLDYNCKCYIWKNIILKNKQLEFYNLPSPRSKFIYNDRFQFVDPDTGVCVEQKPTSDCYPVSIVREDSSGLKGSCSTFTSRRNVSANVRLHENELSHVEKKYGETFVIVASQRLRCMALYGRNNYETELYKIIFDDKIYSFLERIGRARHQGELTFGHGNINHAFKIKPANTFPLRKKLKKYHLITVQDFSLKQLGSSPNAAGKLLFLSRFHKDHVPLYVNYLTNISNLLSICHQERLPLTQVKESQNFSEEVFRKILRLGSKYMKVEMRPYREFFPNAEPKEYLTKGKNAERGVKVLKLVAPYKGTMNDDEAEEKLGDDEDDVDIDCSSANGFGMFPEESTFLPHLDQSTLAHCHKVIDAYGTEGVKGKELGARMHFSVFDMRLIWKSLEKRESIEIIKVEEGKHRFRKLCLKKNSRPSCLPKLILPCKNSKLDQSFNCSSVSLCEVKDELEISQNISMDLLSLFDENTASLRNVTRANIIVDLVKNHKIISDIQVFKQRIYNEEGNKLFSTKSLRKILQLLVSNGKIRKFEKSGLIESGERKFDFYCDLSVEEESIDLQKALQYQLQKERTSLLASDAKTIQESTSSENIPILKFPSTTHNKPKFAKAKVIHQFLWYLVYGSEDLEEESHHSQLNESYVPDWQKHISPLPKLPDHPKGWCNISDVVDNMPLSIFLNAVLSISPDEVSGLESYTCDSERIHARLHDIPVQIVCQLTNGRRYLFKLLGVCETLAKLGLLSFGKYDLIKKEKMFMYVHLEASLTNIPDRLLYTPLFSDIGADGRKAFHLSSLRDIHNYWIAFQTVSLDVTAEPLAVKKYKSKELRMKFCDCLKGKMADEIVDDGRIPGDGLGPGGTDSTFFASLRRNWCQSNDGCIQVESFAFSGYTKKHPRVKKEKTLTIGTSVIKVKPTKPVKVKAEKPTRKGPALGTKHLKRRSTKLNKEKKRPSKDLYEDTEEETNAVDHVTAEVGETALNDMRERLKRKRCYDEKDEEALKLMTRMRVSWSPEEDRVILLCILTNLFLANNFKWIVPSTAVREILHEKIESSRTKTALASLRRKNYLLKKEGVRKNILVYLSEALQNKELCDEFRKGKKYNMSRIKDNEVPFRSCLEKLERNFCQRESHGESTLNLPDTTEEFHRNFTITDPYCHLATSLKEATTLRQVDFYTLQNVVHAFALLTDKIGRAHELYQLLSQFPQSVLSPVLKYMITVGIFTKLKRCDPKSTDKIPPTSTGSYQLTQRYHYLFLVTYPKTIFKSTFDLYSSFPPRSRDPCHGSKFVSLADTSASAALVTTLMVNNMLQVETVTPAEIVVIQPTSEAQSPAKAKPTKKADPRVDDDDDDDDSDDNDFLDNIDPKTSSTNSRTLLSWYRCQYAHSKSSKLMDLGNNLFINSCSVKIRLQSDYQTTTKASTYVSWMNSVYALDKVKDWNSSNASIHPKTCSVLLKFLRTSFPESIDSDDLAKRCLDILGPSSFDIAEDVRADVQKSGFVGRTIEELLVTFEMHSMATINHVLKIMSALNLVVRVGVNNFRYVCFEHAKNWLVQAKKNLKGRGIFYKNRCQFSFDNFPIEKTLEKVECPRKDKSSCDDSNDDASDEERTEEEEDVEVVLKYGNFTIKQKVPKKSSETTEVSEVLESNVEQTSVPEVDPTSTHKNDKVHKQTLQSGNVTPTKAKSKPVSSKRFCDSPAPRPAKKAKTSHENADVPEAPESGSRDACESRSNETQIDFLIDQFSNSAHNESNYAEPVLSRDQNNKSFCVNNKRPGDPSICLPVKRQKSDEMLYTDFVQDPNFNFSSYLKESSSVLNDSSEFQDAGRLQMHGHHFAPDRLCSPASLGLPYSSQSSAGYALYEDLNGAANQGYTMPISSGKDIPVLLNGQGDGRDVAIFGRVGAPLHQLDGATDVEDSTSENEKCQDNPQLRFSDRIRNNLHKTPPSHSSGPTPKGTYKTVRTLPRPWKTPEGTINRAALSSMLESICLFLLEHPGITKEVFLEKYQKVLQPIVLLEFIEILESIGVLKKMLLKKSHKPSLFSKRYTTIPTSEYRGMVTEVYFASPDCIIKMGHFLSQLHANKRTDDAED